MNNGIKHLEEQQVNSKQTSDGGYIIGGTLGGIGPPDIVLVKTDGNGNEQWYKTFEEQGVMTASRFNKLVMGDT